MGTRERSCYEGKECSVRHCVLYSQRFRGVSFKWIAHSSENVVAGPGIGATRRLRLRVRVTTIRVLPWQNFWPMIHMTAADFDAITHGRALCDADGAIDAAGFEIMMREQVSSDMIRRETSEKVC